MGTKRRGGNKRNAAHFGDVLVVLPQSFSCVGFFDLQRGRILALSTMIRGFVDLPGSIQNDVSRPMETVAKITRKMLRSVFFRLI